MMITESPDDSIVAQSMVNHIKMKIQNKEIQKEYRKNHK